MLYREHPPGTFARWNGEPINGIAHPRSIEQRWSEAELAAAGLYVPVRPDVPEGKLVVSETVQRVEGVVQFVYELEDQPAPTSEDVNEIQSLKELLVEKGVLTAEDIKPKPRGPK